MGWLTTAPGGKTQRHVVLTERRWLLGTPLQRSERTITTVSTIYRAMAEGTALALAASLRKDTRDLNGVGQLWTAETAEGNDAGAYNVLLIQQEWTAWSAWA